MPIYPINCEESEQGQITWNYLNENPQTADADEYEIQGAALKSSHQVKFQRQLSGWGGSPVTYNFSFSFQSINYQNDIFVTPANEGYVVLVKADSIVSSPATILTVGSELIADKYPGYHGVTIARNRGIIYSTENITEVIELEPPIQVLQDTDITFIVRNKGEQIFIRTEFNQIPFVSTNCLFTNQCPENTCRVDCGNHYCCYNSDGYSIYSYLKS